MINDKNEHPVYTKQTLIIFSSGILYDFPKD